MKDNQHQSTTRRAATGRRSVAALAIFTVLSACGGEADDTSSRPPVTVRVATVEMGPATTQFRAAGAVRAGDRVTLTASDPGIVEAVAVADGAQVAAGDVILRLRDDEERAARDAAEARLAEARADLERAETLFRQGHIAEARLETARSTRQAAGAEAARATERLEDRAIRAPFDGVLGIITVSPGAYLTPGEPVATLVASGARLARFEAPADIAAGMSVGDTVRVRDAASKYDVEARIVTRAPTELARTRLAVFEAALGADAPPPGRFVTVDITTQTRPDALFMPETALVREGRDTFVFVADDGAARRVAVETGVRREGAVEVRGDLAPDALVIVAGVQKVSDGGAVRVQEKDDGEEAASRPADAP